MTDEGQELACDAQAWPNGRIAALANRRWSAVRARSWQAARPWLCGFNFLPSTAVNFVEMWQPASFDAPTIGRELGWAAEIGFNTLRANLPFTVWNADRDGLRRCIDSFLAMADGLELATVFCLLDDCGFSGEGPTSGRQPDLVPGIHNSRAVASPGREIVMDPAQWSGVEAYIRDIVGAYRADERVLAWDVYNEPGNAMIFSARGERAFDPALEDFSQRLMIEAFSWCRDLDPTQPLTVAAWHLPVAAGAPRPAKFYAHPCDRAALALSDVVSFHAYCSRSWMEGIIAQLRAPGRPLWCTEWMARSAGSRIEEQLPLFRSEGVGAWQWGLVNGRTQTHLPWPTVAASLPAGAGDAEWFHDLLHPDGRPYSASEVATIRRLTRQGQ